MFSLAVMRAFAIFAISNSHLRELHHYHFLATGGMLGNTVFFFISGFGITLGLLKRPETLSSWYKRRLIRIYEPLIILTVFFLTIGYRTVSSAADTFRLFVFPFDYWFIPAIAVFYIPAYLFARYGTKPAFAAAFVGLTVIYVVAYVTFVDLERWNVEDHVLVKSIFYFVAMLCGIYIAKFHASFSPSNRNFPLFSVSTALFFSFLFVIEKFGIFYIQGLAEVFALFWTFAFYIVLRDPVNIDWIASNTRVASGIEFVSAITLQMYLLGEFILSQKALKFVPYPLNIVLFFAVLIASAWVLSKISITTFVERRKLQTSV